MPAPVPTSPVPYPRPGRLRVGNPISAGSAGHRWNDDLLFLLSHATQPIAAVSLPLGASATSPHSIKLTYVRSPGVQVLAVSVELHVLQSYGVGEVGTCLVTAALSGASPIGANPLDGSTALYANELGYRRGRPYRMFLDVSGLTPGTVQTLTITWEQVDNSEAIARVCVTECPMPAAAPDADPTNEPGISPDWLRGGMPLHDGATSRPLGFARIIDQLDKARSQVRRHWQLATVQDENYAWVASSTSTAALNWQLAGSPDPVWTIRPRRLYATSTSNPYTAVIRYRTSVNTTGHGGEITFHTDNGIAAPADTTVTLAASSSWTTATSTLYLPTDAPPCTLRIRGAINFLGENLLVSNIALVEDEP